MEQLLDQVWTLLRQQLESNQFLSGGAVLMLVGVLCAVCRTLPGKIWHWITLRLFVEFEISMKDDAFMWFNEWLAGQPYSKNWARWLSVRTVRRGNRDGQPSLDGELHDHRPSIILSPAPGVHWLWWKGYLVIVHRERKEPESNGSNGRGSYFQHETYNVSILTWRRDLVLKLVEEARDLSEPPDDNRVRIYLPHYGEWCNDIKRRPRPLESVILKEGVLDGLLADARRFLSSEQWYIDRGIPYRRGYLLHGPPGNGKSSIILALASALKLDICVLNLNSSGVGDDELRRMFATVPENAIICIEDIDCVFEQREKTDDKDSKVTFSGLLNAIDGVVAAEGRILVMTTNFPEKLDDALVRPGRCDVKLLLGNADHRQAERLFLRFFPDSAAHAQVFGEQLGTGRHSMAALQGHLLKFADCPANAISSLSELTAA